MHSCLVQITIRNGPFLRHSARLAVCCLACLINCALYGQSGIVAAGGSETGAGGSVSFSAGQMAFVYQTGAGGSVSPGQQQAHTASQSQPTGIGSPFAAVSGSVYPNPATDHIWLALDIHAAVASYEIYDLYGRTVLKNDLRQVPARIGLESLRRGIYMLRVTDRDTPGRFFRIILE